MKCVIANGLSDSAKNKLNNLGIRVFETRSNDSVNKNISLHADISFLFDGEGTLFIASEMAEYKNIFTGIVSVVIIPEKLGNEYPRDVLLNCVPLGKKLICNVDTVSQTVLEYFKNKDYDILNVRQGYTKCSVIPVSDNSIITDDLSIAKLCLSENIDVLTVSKGCVKLYGYDYGFIGGASGRISENTIVFCGDINSHPDSESILQFLDKYGMTAISLDDSPLYDIGSIIPLYGG